MEEDKPLWDAALADALPHARVLIRVTGLRPDGKRVGAVFWGIVTTADQNDGITVALEGDRKGDRYVLPPDHRAIRRAPQGTYTIKKTGEVVEGLDFVVSWVVKTGPGLDKAEELADGEEV